MRLPLRFILVLLSLASFHGLRAQTVCGTEDPFLTPPEKTFCVDSSGTVFIEFNLTNKGTEAGNYTITFPDGIDSTYLGVVGEVRVTHTMSFDCGGQIWDAELPTEADPFYAYKSKLVILRTDCTDAEGKPQRGSFDFNVLPNPIKDIQISDVTCRAAPYLVDLSAQLCDEDLVDTYTWYLDGDRIAGADEQSVTDVLIRRPGMHTIRLEVTTASDKCPSFTFEKDINITAAPSIDLDYTVLDALCSSVIRINTIATVTNATTYRWSSPSPEVSFSDPEALNPTVTINNEQPGSRTIILTANSENCGRVVESFTIETFTEQMIEPRSPLSVCTNVPLALGDQLVYSPAPDRITWSSPDPEVSIDGATTEDPRVTVTTPGTFTLTASGTDVCGQAFSTTVPVRIRDGSPLEVDFSAVDTLCPTEAPLDLRQYVSNPGNLSTITGPGVTGTLLDVSNLAGPLRLEITDSCGGVYPVEFFVLTEGEFAGGNPVVCQGQTLNLNGLQPGTYSGTGVVNNRFESAGLVEGDYTIDYTSTAYCGGSGQFTITVDPPVAASFRLASDSCGTVVPPGIAAVYRTDDPVALVNTSTAPVISYTIVETGEQLLGQDSTTFTLATAGRYTLQQVVGFPGATCSDTAVQVIEVRAPFDVAFDVAVDSSACDSLTYTFTAAGEGRGVTYDWRFSTGDSSTVQNPVLRIARPLALETLRATVVASNGCFARQDTLFRALPRRFQVAFGILNDNNTVCSGDTALLIDNSVGADRLRVQLGDGSETDALPPFLVIRNTTQEVIAYPIRVEGFNATCPAQAALDTLYVLPVTTRAAFSLVYSDDCSPAQVGLINLASPGASSKVTWGDGSTPQIVPEGDTVYHTYTVDRDTTFAIGMISQLCGIDTFTTSLTVRAGANAAFMIDPTAANCIDNALSFFPVVPAATQSLVWDFGDGGTSILPQPIYAYDSVGDYRVKLRVTNENGCTATDSLDVSIGSYAGPPLRASIPTEICVDAPYNLSLRGFGTEITYDYGNQLRSAVPIERPYQVDTTYRLVLTATDAAGCTIDTSAMVRVYPRFTVGILPEEEVVTVEFGSPLDLSFQMEPIRLLDSIRWLGDSLSSLNTQRTQADPTEDGIYRLAVTDEFGCLATDSIRVNVTKEYGDRIYVPNAFSPNGDGQNETFGIDVKPNTVRAIHAVRVLSRWGALVYECTDCKPGTAGTGWDGRVGDQPSKPDVYVWIADIEFTDGHREVFRGDVALLR